MHAGVNYRQIPPERMDEALRTYRESTLPEVRTQQGFKGALILADRNVSKIIGIGLFETLSPEGRRCARSTRSALMIGLRRK